MSTYQILDIALNGVFFATVAAIAVVFVILRDGSAGRESHSALPSASRKFEESLVEATAIMPSAADLMPRSATVSRSADFGQNRIRFRPDQDVPVKLTRAERELMESIGHMAQR
jgi:hypothetical protein